MYVEDIMEKGKEIEMEISFLYFTQSGKMTVSVDCDKLCIYNVISRASS